MVRSIEDEGLHLHLKNDDESWQESVVVSWRDCKTGVGANLHMGCELNRELSNVLVGVYRDNDVRYSYNADDLPLKLVSQGHGLTSGPLTVVHDGKQLRAIVDAPECQINLIVTDLTQDVSSPVDHDDEFREQVASNHFNVECRVQGTVTLGEQTYQVDGLGHRDHSFGPRTFTEGKSVIAYRWLAGGLQDGTTFSLFSMLTANGAFTKHGWVRASLNGQGGQKQAIKHNTNIMMLEDGLSADSATASCVLDDGSHFDIHYTVRGDALMTVRELHNVMSTGDIVMADGRCGYATLEYIECASQGTKYPVSSVGVALENGLSKQPASRCK